ncbi:MAG: Yip1 family protein [Bacillota bacterium]|jgi:hypothetical protein|nr:Yip1 family protein [Bacillota bacterium]HHT90345.1 YIP1 family protein [Bacillota bacterium]
MKQFWEKLIYSRYVIFHPFDGFYEIKFRDRGDASIATLFLLVNGLLAVVATQYSGFVVNHANPKHMNSLLIVFYSVLPYLIFVVGNYSTTTLFEGKGTMREIYIVLGYALVPVIATQVMAIVLSQFITADEVPIYSLLLAAGGLWFVFLVFTGLNTIHDYGFLKNLVTLAVTGFAIGVILFLILLAYSLIQELVAFVQLFTREALVRLEGWLL